MGIREVARCARSLVHAQRQADVDSYATLSEECERMLVVIVPPGPDDTYGADGRQRRRTGYNAVAPLKHFDPNKDEVGIVLDADSPDPA